MSDLEARSDDYDRRAIAAGSAGDIVGALVKGAERSKRFARWLAVSVALDVILSIVLGVVGLVALHNARGLEAQALTSCRQTNQNSAVINEFLDLLIDNAKVSTLLTPVEIRQRVTQYTGLIITIPKCD